MTPTLIAGVLFVLGVLALTAVVLRVTYRSRP